MFDMRNNLSLLYDFYIVAKEKSFSDAAEKNVYSQSNLSRNIQKLEDELNLKLINRSNKGIKLTKDGENLYKTLDEMFSNFSEYETNYLSNNDDLKGKIVIGTTRNIADNRLSEYLTKFYQKYPNVQVKIVTDNARNLNEYLINHKIDVLIDYLPQINFTEKSDLEIKNIGYFETCFACSQEFYNVVSKDIKSIEDLKRYKLIIPGSSRRRQGLDSILQPKNIELSPIIEMPDSKLMAEFIKSNNCIGYFIKEEVNDYNLKELKLIEEMPKNPIGIVYPKKTINNIANKFVELVLEKQ